jgi:hypothetical protein
MTAPALIELTELEAEGLVEEWGVPLHVKPDPRPEPATVPTINLRVPTVVPTDE